MRKDHEKWEWFNYLYKNLYKKSKDLEYTTYSASSPGPAQPLPSNKPLPSKMESPSAAESAPRKKLELSKSLQKKLGYWH
jgi:hypothetical protein